MNANQRQNVVNIIDEFKSLDLSDIFVSKFGNESKPEETFQGDYSILDIFTLSKRVFLQLEEKISDLQYWQLLPATHTFNNDFGACSLEQNLKNLQTYISRGDFANSVVQLKILIYYQIANGFWEKPTIFDKSMTIKKIQEVAERIELLQAHLFERREQLESLREETIQTKTGLDKYISAKNDEFSVLDDRLEESKVLLENMKSSKEAAVSLAETTNSIKEDCEELKQEIDTTQKESKDTQAEIDKKLSDFEKLSVSTFDNMQQKLDVITSDHSYVHEKKEEVRKMMSYISDGTLSHSFNSRKTEIKKSTNLWLWVSVGSAILMGVWIFVVFTCLKASTENIAIDLIINAVKTTPLIALFWFSLKQYSKERNLLEEYAFREAIAITLTAYADQIEQTESTNDKKVDLIKETVDRLYTKPQISNEGIGLFSFKSKDLVELLQEVKEIVNSIKSSK